MKVGDFSFAIACVGGPAAPTIPSRAEVIGIATPVQRFGAARVQRLAEPYVFDARFTFTHFVGDVDGGFLLGR